MYNIKKEIIENSSNDVSTQCENSINSLTDEQTQVSQTRESKNTQTSYVYSPNFIEKQQSISSSQSKHRHLFVNPYSIIDRVNQGEQFLKFLHKQNKKLDVIFTTFLKNLQQYTDNFLLPLQQEHCLYGIYRQDMIRYMITLQEYINELRMKLNILQEANKNFILFRKHFHKIIHSKSDLEYLLNKHDKYIKQNFDRNESVKYQEQFWNVYQKSYIQLQTIEQQRLLAVREQMRFATNLTIRTINDYNLFSSNNFDDILKIWDQQHIIPVDHWNNFAHRPNLSRQDTSFNVLNEIKQILNEYYNHRKTISNHKHLTLDRISNQLNTIESKNNEFLSRMDSITSDMSYSHI